MNESDCEYRNAVFEALITYQAIECLLRDCILICYDLLDRTSHGAVTYKPSERHLKDVKNRMGLGSLLDIFSCLTNNKKLCKEIKCHLNSRNKLAHGVANNYLKAPPGSKAELALGELAEEIYLDSERVNRLYFELHELRSELKKVHGEVV